MTEIPQEVEADLKNLTNKLFQYFDELEISVTGGDFNNPKIQAAELIFKILKYRTDPSVKEPEVPQLEGVVDMV